MRQPPQAATGSGWRPVDVLSIAFLSALTLICLFFAARIPSWKLLVLMNIGATALIIALGLASRYAKSAVLGVARDWYVLPLIFVCFKEVYYMVSPIHFGHDYDPLLIQWDRWIFGADPTVWAGRFAQPLLTEIFQIAYALFFVNFILIGGALYGKDARACFHRFAFVCGYGFFLSYLCYFFLPAIGPRFTLHDFSMLARDLPGIWLTPLLRSIVDFGDSIPPGATKEVAAALVQRDAFPSGHTMMTLVAIYMSFKYRISLRHFVAVSGSLLIIGTVYLRYHYVIDLAAGALLAIICLTTWSRVYDFLLRRCMPEP